MTDVANFNDIDQLDSTLAQTNATAVLVQVTRQKPDDSYALADVIRKIKSVRPDLPIVTDDNYAVMKIPAIGVECGADLSCFSTFKLLGPEASVVSLAKKKESRTYGRPIIQVGSKFRGMKHWTS